MARTPKPKKPKLPKPKAPLGQRIKNEAQRSLAKGLSKNFGVLGTAIAKRYVAPSPRKRVPDPGKANQKNIPKKDVKKDSPIVEAISESNKQVAATIDIVAQNAGRSFALATRQATIMGDEISGSMRELNNILDRMLYKGPQPPPLPPEAYNGGPQIQSQSVSQMPTGDSNIPWVIPMPSLKTMGILSIIPALKTLGLMSGQGGISSSREDMIKEIEKNNQRPEAVEAGKRAEAVQQWLGKWFGWMGIGKTGEGTDKVEVGKDHVIFKMTYKADKITFKSENLIKFKTRSTPFSYPQKSGGFFNKLADKMTGGPGSAGFFNNLADRIFGTGSDLPGSPNYKGGATNSAGAAGQSADVLRDETGKKIDPDTMKKVEELGRSGDTSGLQKLFASKGYHMSGPACGVVASAYVSSAGFQPPKSSAIATSWHNWGEKAGTEDINKENRPFGSMVATYYHGRYGGTQGQVLQPGQTGGHVMTIVPGTYDPKTNTAMFADQHGSGVSRRAVTDMNIRYAGDKARDEVAAMREAAKNAPAGDVDKKENAGPDKNERLYVGPNKSDATPITKGDAATSSPKDDAPSSVQRLTSDEARQLYGDQAVEDIDNKWKESFDFERWKWMRPKNPEDIEDRTGEDSSQYETVTAKAAARIREIAGNRWMAAQPIPAPSTLSIRLGSNNLDFALIATSRKEVRESLGLPDPKKSNKQQFMDESDGLNTQTTKQNQSIDNSDLDHRPRREAVPPQKYDDYMGTSSGMEDAD